LRYQIKNKLAKNYLGGKGLKIFNYIEDTFTGEIIEGLGDACKRLNAQDVQIEDMTAALKKVNRGES